jgi:hypothetical protein
VFSSPILFSFVFLISPTAAPEEIPLLKANVESEGSLLGADEEAWNYLHKVGEQQNKDPGHAEDNAISYEIDEDDNSIVDFDAGKGASDSHMEDDEEPVDPLLGVFVESGDLRFADAEVDESFFLWLEKATDSRLRTDTRGCKSLLDADGDDFLLDNDDDGPEEPLLDEDGDDSLLDAEEKGYASLLNLYRKPSDFDSLATILDGGTDELVRYGWCEDAVLKPTVNGLKGLANHLQRGLCLPYPEHLKQATNSAPGKKTRGLQATADDRETQGKKRAETSSQRHDQSDWLDNRLSGSPEKDFPIKTVFFWQPGIGI